MTVIMAYAKLLRQGKKWGVMRMLPKKRMSLLLVLVLVCICAFALAHESRTTSLVQAVIDAGSPAIYDMSNEELSLEQMQTLMETFPQTFFKWHISMFGITVSSEDTVVDFGKNKVSDLALMCDYINCLPRLKQVDLYHTVVKKDFVEQMHSRCEGVRFNWVIRIKDWNIRTDVTAFSTLSDGSPPYLKSEDLWLLKYLKDLKALDLGHHAIDDLSFLYDLPNLKVLILAVNKIQDITPIASLQELEYVELFKNKIEDITPLASLTKLKRINLCHNQIADITPLLALDQLEMVWIGGYNKPLSDEMKQRLIECLPNANVNLSVYWSTEGWRDDGYYPVIRRMFRKRVYEPFE